MQVVRSALFASMLVACTTPGKVESFEDDGFEAKSRTADSTVGVNDKGQAVLKSETDAGVELQSQQMANYSMRERLNLAVQDLQRCHDDLAGLKGGDAAGAAPDIDIPDEDGAEEKIGLNDGGELKVRHTEIYTARLETERKRGAKLEALLKRAKKLDDKCQSELRVEKSRHPVPAAP